MSAFNLLNTNAAFSANYQSGPTFGFANAIQDPRVFRLGANFEPLILEAGAEKARAIASATSADVRAVMGVGPARRPVSR